nr:unnamed protein product [Callosobruchus chinensis]
MSGGVFCLLTSPDLACGLQMVVVGYQGVHSLCGLEFLWRHTQWYFLTRVSLTAVGYIAEILQDFVVPNVDFSGNNFILMHDNARPHTARITQQYLNDVDFDVLKWQALSPDANPIEHVWNMLGRRIRSHVPISLTECDLIPQEDICHLILGMPRRMQAIIRARGGKTRY